MIAGMARSNETNGRFTISADSSYASFSRLKETEVTTFLLIRHGATDVLGRAIVGRSVGIHINRQGEMQAQRLAEILQNLPITVIACSPLERTHQTAAPLATRLGLPIRACQGFNEVAYGEWTGHEFQALADQSLWRQYNQHRSNIRIPGGEMAIEMQARVVAEMNLLQEEVPESMVAVFSHGDPIKTAIAHCLGMPLDFILRLEISPASISVITIEQGWPRVLTINHTGDCPPPLKWG